MKVESFPLPIGETVPLGDLSKIESLLRELLAELRELHRDLQRRRSTATDDEFLRQVVPALAGRFGSQVFTTKDVFSDPAIRRLIGNRTRAQVGAMFAKAVDAEHAINGYTISRPGREHNAALWSVLRVVKL